MPAPASPRLLEAAPAKVNLTLHVGGRRADGYHEIESLVAFARRGDALALLPGGALSLAVRGPFAAAAGAGGDNLVIKAARELASRIEGLAVGRFVLSKRLPVAAGLGGGSADAAAALRLIARANGLDPGDARLLAAARAVGADVPVCLQSRATVMRGIGDVLGAPLDPPPLHAVLANPGVPVATGAVFAALDADAPEATSIESGAFSGKVGTGFPKENATDIESPAFSGKVGTGFPKENATDIESPAFSGRVGTGFPKENATSIESPCGLSSPEAVLAAIAGGRNDLEAAATAICPAIATVLAALAERPRCRLARMSGSGATCFGLFGSEHAAADAARVLRSVHPGWWVRATLLG